MADQDKNQAAQNGAQPSPPKRDEDPVGKVYDSRLMRRLSRYVRPYWLQATIASIAVSLKSLCDVAGPILVMVAVDRYLLALALKNVACCLWMDFKLARILVACAWVILPLFESTATRRH